MKVELEKDQLDLGVTPIENMFINTFMADANESQIKVYLYALSLVYSGEKDLSNSNIAKEMNLTEGQVLDAWEYWIERGVVVKNGESYIFRSMRLQMFGQELPNLQQSTYHADRSEDNNVNESNEATRDMINSIEGFISQGKDVPIKLDPREIRKIVELMNSFTASPEFISYAYMMASNVRGTKSVDPLVATIRNWMIDGATDMEKLDAYIEDKNRAKEERKNNPKKYPTSSKKNTSYKEEDRMTKDERRAFVESKLNQKIPINRKNNEKR